MDNPNIICVRAAYGDKTYYGASFCSDETTLRNICESIDPLVVIDLNRARSAVQEGMSSEDAMVEYDLEIKRRGKVIAFSVVAQNCLEVIESGGCQVYPK